MHLPLFIKDSDHVGSDINLLQEAAMTFRHWNMHITFQHAVLLKGIINIVHEPYLTLGNACNISATRDLLLKGIILIDNVIVFTEPYLIATSKGVEVSQTPSPK
jgi:hypothetical protein